MDKIIEKLASFFKGKNVQVCFSVCSEKDFTVKISDFPEWFINYCYFVETEIVFKNGNPLYMFVITITGYDPADVDALAEAVPLSRWDNLAFMEHGMTEETYDCYRLYLPPEAEIVEELFTIDLQSDSDTASMKFAVKITARIELSSADRMWYVLENLSKKEGKQD